MQLTERKRLKILQCNNSEYGIVELSKPAKAETVQVTYNQKTIIPESFNIFGEPIFSKEMTYCILGEEAFLSRNSEDITEVFLDISYEVQPFSFDNEKYNTLGGITHCLKDFKSLHDLLTNRLFAVRYCELPLDVFILFGKYELNQFGLFLYLDYMRKPNLPSVVKIPKPRHPSGYPVSIPHSNERCSCCCKEITIDDFKKNSFYFVNDKFYHTSCIKEFCTNYDIYHISNAIGHDVYNQKIKFDTIHHDISQYGFDEDIPKYIIYTPDGDIIVGTKFNSYYIEWQNNFKPFDISILENDNNFPILNTTIFPIKPNKVYFNDITHISYYLNKVKIALANTY